MGKVQCVTSVLITEQTFLHSMKDTCSIHAHGYDHLQKPHASLVLIFFSLKCATERNVVEEKKWKDLRLLNRSSVLFASFCVR